MKQQEIEAALSHLQEADPVLRTLIFRVGAYTLRPNRDRFGMLVRSILSQQVSTKAAQSIRLRLEAMLASEGISAESLSSKTIEELRSVGISGQKASYLHDLSAHVLDGRLKLNTIGRKSDDAVVERLTAVKGIGEWTAHMFLIFALGRPDVFPHGDLGVRSALKILYDLEELPDKTTSLELAEPWRPYASIATWYCWRLHDLPADANQSA